MPPGHSRPWLLPGQGVQVLPLLRGVGLAEGHQTPLAGEPSVEGPWLAVPFLPELPQGLGWVHAQCDPLG